MEVLPLVYSFILIAIAVLLYSKWKYSYWKDRSVFHVEPTFFYGHLKDLFRKDQHFCEFLKNQYDVAKSKGIDYFGVYKFWNPVFVPINLELIKRIINTDYSNFSSHGTGVKQESDVLSGHLFRLQDEEWKSMRTKLTPTFTSGKMKMMFQTMTHCADGLENMLRSSVQTNEAMEIKDILSRFTTDIIGNVVFGIDIDSMINPDNEFIRYGKTIFKLSPKKRILLGLQLLFPSWLTSIIGTNGHDTDLQMFFLNLVKNTVKYREENNILRKDFMHLLIQLKNLGRITEEDGTILEKDGNSNQGLTFNQITAQAYVFFIAGFETSATTMTFVLLELAQNQAIQDRLRKEIQTVLNKDNNKFTYESITGMEYLEMVVSETLRKHPPGPSLIRACTKRYTVPNSNLVIEPGVRVEVPLFAIHRDPEFYPDPDKFDPERFSEKNKATRSPFTYFPFGEGPRTCIGLRFGKLQAKVGLCTILKDYRVTLHPKTQIPISYDSEPVLSVKGGVWLNLESLH